MVALPREPCWRDKVVGAALQAPPPAAFVAPARGAALTRGLAACGPPPAAPAVWPRAGADRCGSSGSAASAATIICFGLVALQPRAPGGAPRSGLRRRRARDGHCWPRSPAPREAPGPRARRGSAVSVAAVGLAEEAAAEEADDDEADAEDHEAHDDGYEVGGEEDADNDDYEADALESDQHQEQEDPWPVVKASDDSDAQAAFSSERGQKVNGQTDYMTVRFQSPAEMRARAREGRPSESPGRAVGEVLYGGTFTQDGAVQGGLFCEDIFGTRASYSRRERPAFYELAWPCDHVWFTRGRGAGGGLIKDLLSIKNNPYMDLRSYNIDMYLGDWNAANLWRMPKKDGTDIAAVPSVGSAVAAHAPPRLNIVAPAAVVFPADEASDETTASTAPAPRLAARPRSRQALVLAALSRSALRRHLPPEAARLSRAVRQALLGARLGGGSAGLQAADLARVGATLRSEVADILALAGSAEAERLAVQHLAADVARWLQARGVGLEDALQALRLQLRLEPASGDPGEPPLPGPLAEGDLFELWQGLVVPRLGRGLEESLREISGKLGYMEPCDLERVLLAVGKLLLHGQAALDLLLRARCAAAGPAAAAGEAAASGAAAAVRSSRFGAEQEREVCWYDPTMTTASFHLEDVERRRPLERGPPLPATDCATAPRARSTGGRGGLTTPSKRAASGAGEAAYYARDRGETPSRWHWPLQDAELPGRGGGARPLRRGQVLPKHSGASVLRYSAARPRPAGTPPSVPSSLEAEGALFVGSGAATCRRALGDQVPSALRQDLAWRCAWLGGVLRVERHLTAVREAIGDVDQTGGAFTVSSAVAEADVSMGERKSGIDTLLNKGMSPEWAILTDMPVMPPDLRTMGGKDFESTSIGDLSHSYVDVIQSSDTLRRNLEFRRSDAVLRQSKLDLQEKVDIVLDNGRIGSGKMKGQKGELMDSIAGRLKGKQGRMRLNLLGKRVDYSARTVIVVDPALTLDECAMPYQIARQLFQGFLVAELLKTPEITEEFGSIDEMTELRPRERLLRESAILDKFDQMVEEERWRFMTAAMGNRRVMLNRAPTLHRLGIQAFKPRLIDGQALKIHPLVCAPFNADFDGDTMTMHLALSDQAQLELETLMAPSKNICSPATGDAVIGPTQDMVLGIYYMTSGAGGRRAAPRHCQSAQDLELVAQACAAGELAHSVEVTVALEALQEFSPEAFEDDPQLATGAPGGEVKTYAGRVLFFWLVHGDSEPEQRLERQLLASLDGVPLAEP